jgi:hypothetical protein
MPRDLWARVFVSWMLTLVGGVLIGSAVSDMMRPACPVTAMPAMGSIAPGADYRAVRYVLPSIGETVLPPVSRRSDVRVVVEFLAPDAIASACAGAEVAEGTWGEALGCTVMWPGRPTIVLPNPCSFPWDDYAALVCHEVGHVNGWRHEREDGA